MIKCLAFDTTAGACAAALLSGDTVLAEKRLAMDRGHTEALVPLLQEVVAEAGERFETLDLIGVTVGPGAFTGIRIGLATARGLALAANLPVAGVTTLRALAASVPPAERGARRVLAAIDSKRGDFYAQSFGADLVELQPAAVLTVAEMTALAERGPMAIVGDAPEAALAGILGLPGVVRARATTVDPAALAREAIAAWQDGRALPPEPLYLRPPEATPPARRGLRP